jgi:hypothetical protein
MRVMRRTREHAMKHKPPKSSELPPGHQPGDRYEGVMAQDVLKVMPEAVSIGPDGYYRVNYKMLGVPLRRYRNGVWSEVPL